MQTLTAAQRKERKAISEELKRLRAECLAMEAIDHELAACQGEVIFLSIQLEKLEEALAEALTELESLRSA